MSKIEERVVSMKFQNSQFLSGITTALSALKVLKDGLSFQGGEKGFDKISAAAKNVDLDSMSTGVDKVSTKFAALATVAITALANITNKAVNAGLQMAKSFTLEPIMEGFGEYELKMGSIQTILANTARHGTTLETVNKELDNLNKYADKTIYNFAEMTKNASLFTNSGMKIEDATSVIKGFSNEAAASGTSAAGAAGAAYQLSQALSAGTIRLMDWRSLTNVGMGGKNMQDGIIKVADAMGMFNSETTTATAAGEDFNGSLEKQWLSADVMSNYLRIMAGDMSEAEMATLGLDKATIKTLRSQAETAQEAATKVRTFTQLIGTLKEATASGWTETMEIIFGDFEEATELFTNASEVLGGAIDAMSDRRNAMFAEWKDLGGRTKLIEALGNAFKALVNIIKPIKGAFEQIFPPMTGKTLFAITEAIANFTEKLVLSADTMDKVQRVFAGVFAVLDIGWTVIKMVADVLGNLFRAATSGSTGFLELAATVGDFLVKIRDAVKSGEGLQKFFNRLSYYLVFGTVKLKQFIAAIVEAISNFDLFGSLDVSPVGKGLDRVRERAKPLAKIADVAVVAWRKMGDVFSGVWKVMRKVGGILGKMFGELGDSIMESLTTMDFSTVLDTINTGLLAGLFVSVKKFLGSFEGLGSGGSLGFIDSIKGAFGGLTDTLDQMQTTLKSGTLMLIAAAIGILTASIVALSLIDSKKLTTALAAITVMFTQLVGAMAILNGVSVTGGIAKMTALGVGMILLSVAVNILASAVRKLSDLDWEELGKGLAATTALLGALVATSQLMSKNAAGMISAGVGLLLIAAAVRVLVKAVQQLSDMSWADLTKGLVGVGALLGSLAIFTRLAAVNKAGMAQGAGILLLAAALKVLASVAEDFAAMSWQEIGKGLASIAGVLAAIAIFTRVTGNAKHVLATGAALVIIGAAMKILADAMTTFGSMDWMGIAKGLVAMGGALAIIAVALSLMPASTVLSAVAITIVAQALVTLSEVLQSMGGMSWGEIAKGLVTLAGSLVIIAAAMALMTTALAGAAALLVVSASLAVLGPVLIAFGEMSWMDIVQGLTMLAGAFTVIGLAGLVLTPVIPSLMLLGVAITLLGVAVLLAGAGVLAFSAGLAALAVSGAAGAAALVGIVTTMLSILPMIIKAIGQTLIEIAKVIAIAAPAIVQAITVVISSLLQAIRTLTPQIIQTFIVIMNGILRAINATAPSIVATFMRLLNLLLNAAVTAIPRIARAGLQIIVGFLDAIRDKVPEIVDIASDIIVKFIDGIARNLPKIIESGVNLIVEFIEGCASSVRNNSARMNSAGLDLATAIIDGMVGGLASGASRVAGAARDAASAAWNAAKDFLGIHSPSKKFYELGQWSNVGMANAMSDYSGLVADEAAGVGKDAIFAMKKSISGISNLLNDEMDLNPTIAPVLDLSQVADQANGIDRILNTKPLSLDSSYKAARAAEASYVDRRAAEATLEEARKETTKIEFNQHNTSPKALDRVEIYRQTNNQLAMLREEFNAGAR